MNSHKLLPFPVDDGAKLYSVDEQRNLSYHDALGLLYSRYTRVNAQGQREVPPHAARRIATLNAAHTTRVEIRQMALRELKLRALEHRTRPHRSRFLRSWLWLRSKLRFLSHVVRSAKV